MKKRELIRLLKEGQHIDMVLPTTRSELSGYFKADAFEDTEEIIYIPDYELCGIDTGKSLDYGDAEYDILEKILYTGRDLIEMCAGNVLQAKKLFKECCWQSPAFVLKTLKGGNQK